MASHVVVIDTSFRRLNIKVTPGKYMIDVLEEACTKLGLNPTLYALKNNNKPIDLSRTFRQTGLSAGAKLELVITSRTPTVLSVALQLPHSLASAPSNRRLTDKFASDTTLWHVLRKFECVQGANFNFTGRGYTQLEGTSGAGRIYYEMPSLNLMGREYSSFVDLQKTLAQLGFSSGTCLIRLDFKKSARPLEEATAEIGEYFKQEEAFTVSETDSIQEPPNSSSHEDGNKASASPSGELAVDKIRSKSNGTLPMPPSSPKRPEPEQDDMIPGPDQRLIAVYSPPSGQVPKAADIPHNEADFEPTVAHAKLHQSRLLKISQNKRLPSDYEMEQLAQEKAAKLAKTPDVTIKIRFPDQSSIVSRFTAEETGSSLYAFVANVIVADNEPFKLVRTSRGPRTIPSNNLLLIRDLGFEARMLVNFLWEDGVSSAARKPPILKPQYVASAMEVVVPEVPVVDTPDDTEPVTQASGKGKETAHQNGKAKDKLKWMLKGLHNK